MIEVTRLGGKTLIVNADLVETVEATPDTVLTLTSGRKVVVLETPQEIAERVLAYRRHVTAGRGLEPWTSPAASCCASRPWW